MSEEKTTKPLESQTKSKTKACQDLYKILSKPIKEEFLIKYEENGKVFTGYQAQYAINLLGNWHLHCKIRKEEVQNRNWVIAMEAYLTIIWKEHRISIQGHSGMYAKAIANGYKGARTSAFKQCCRYLGIGQELYCEQEDDIIVEEVNEEVTEDHKDIKEKIDKAENIAQLKGLEEKVKGLESKIVLTYYNKKKLTLMQKK